MQEDHAVCSDDASAEHNAEAVRAPRHGLNAKALLLQAAAQAAQEAADIEERAPDTIPAQDQEIANLKAAFAASGKLLSGVPKRETPIVAFVNTTKASKEHHSRCTSPDPMLSYHSSHVALVYQTNLFSVQQKGKEFCVLQCRFHEQLASRCCKSWQGSI